MSLSSRVSRLVPDLAATLERFPACVLAAVALCIIANLEAGDITKFDQDELARIYFAGAAAFLAGGAGHLFALGREWDAMPSALLGLAAGSLAALLCYFYTSTGGHLPVRSACPHFGADDRGLFAARHAPRKRSGCSTPASAWPSGSPS